MAIMGGWRILGWSLKGEFESSFSLEKCEGVGVVLGCLQSIWLDAIIREVTVVGVHKLTSTLRLTSIRSACAGKAQMVLHGTNTFPDEITQKCIQGGMTRINVNDLVLSKYNEFVKENTGKIPLTELMGKGTDLIQELCEYQMDVMGSSGKGEVLY
jgi:hypothetical protein